MEISNNFIHKVGAEVLSVRIFGNTQNKPGFVFLHGAGESDGDRIKSISDHLTSKISILTFDFSGHGKSSGKIENSSLQKRVNEASSVIKKYADLKNLTLCGSSMGGYIAIKLIESLPVKNLILFCPAVYDKNVFSTEFNHNFSSAIRALNSWYNSDAFDILKQYNDKLLIFVGEKDEVIPAELIKRLNDAAQKTSKREIIVLPNCDHAIHKYIFEHRDTGEAIANKIINYTQ